jgi:hypothetical protein
MFVDTHRVYTLYVSGPIVVIIWHDEVTETIVTRLERVMLDTADACDEPITLLVVASFRAPIPSAEIRARIIECFRRLGPRLRAVAQVVEGDGFWAAAARCAIVGINLLSRGAYKRHVFGTRAEALAWLDGRPELDEIAGVLG